MGTKSLFIIHDKVTDKYYHIWIQIYGYDVLKDIRKILTSCKSMKSIKKALVKMILATSHYRGGFLNYNRMEKSYVRNSPTTLEECWPFIEYCMRFEMDEKDVQIYPILGSEKDYSGKKKLFREKDQMTNPIEITYRKGAENSELDSIFINME